MGQTSRQLTASEIGFKILYFSADSICHISDIYTWLSEKKQLSYLTAVSRIMSAQNVQIDTSLIAKLINRLASASFFIDKSLISVSFNHLLALRAAQAESPHNHHYNLPETKIKISNKLIC